MKEPTEGAPVGAWSGVPAMVYAWLTGECVMAVLTACGGHGATKT